MAKLERVTKDDLEEHLFGKRTVRRMEREKELAHVRELAAIQLDTERQLAAIRTQSQTSSEVPIVSPPTGEVQSRKDFIEPYLQAKGWSIGRWAIEANVAVDTAADYLEGKTKSYRSTRVKLAKALGIPVQQLPR